MKRGVKRGRALYEPEAYRFIERLCWLKTRGRCFYCKRPVSFRFEEVKMFKDHFIPLKRGGVDDHSNLVPACRRCDSRKGCAVPPTAPLRLMEFAENLCGINLIKEVQRHGIDAQEKEMGQADLAAHEGHRG